MNIEEFRAAFIQAMQPLVEFAKQVRDIFLEMAQRLRKALAPLWNASALHRKRVYTSLSQMRKGGNRQERRIAWKVLHRARRNRHSYRETILRDSPVRFYSLGEEPPPA